MKLTLNRYGIILSVQTLLIFVDFAINTSLILVRKYNAISLILFIVQDVCLILALAALLLTFFSTYVFQAGLVELLYDRFRLTIIICMVYFILTTVVHIWNLWLHWNEPLAYRWTRGLHCLFIIQRFTAPFYYYFYKRASLRISDPRFYDDIEWEQKPTCN